jgi:hypothetical protein
MIGPYLGVRFSGEVQWANNSGGSTGLTVESDGSFENNEACDEVLHVACCAPVPIAVPEPSAMLLQGSGVAGLLAFAKIGGRW